MTVRYDWDACTTIFARTIPKQLHKALYHSAVVFRKASTVKPTVISHRSHAGRRLFVEELGMDSCFLHSEELIHAIFKAIAIIFKNAIIPLNRTLGKRSYIYLRVDSNLLAI